MRVGLISDTHVPYRAAVIPSKVLHALEGVDLILHAGDVDDPAALGALRAIAPTYAVRGNRHWLDGSDGGAALPLYVTLTLAGFRVVVTHGHPTGVVGLIWRLRSAARNLRGEKDFPALDMMIARTLLARFPRADIIVYGHTHRPSARWWGDTLIVNPGAALYAPYIDAAYSPSLAHLFLAPRQRPCVRFCRELL